MQGCEGGLTCNVVKQTPEFVSKIIFEESHLFLQVFAGEHREKDGDGTL